MTGSRNQVLLLGNGRQSLTVIRSLAREGWAPIVGINGENDQNGYAHLSRHVVETWRHSAFQESEDVFKGELFRFIAQNQNIAAIYPVNADAIRCINNLISDIPRNIPLAMANSAAIEICFDKSASHKTCDEIGLPTATHRIAENRQELRAACEVTGLPCVIKPVDRADLVFGVKVALVQDEKALSNWLQDDRLDGRRTLVQQFVPYPRFSAYFAARDGKLTNAVAVSIKRTDRLDGTGIAVFGQTIDPPPQLQEDCAKFVEAVGYTGVGCFQCLIDPQSSKRTFLEVNPRLGGNFKIVEASGVPYSLIALKLGMGEQIAIPKDPWRYKRGVRCAWTLGALAGCRFEYKTGAAGLTNVARLLGNALFEAITADAHLSWSWKDPLPALAQLTRPLRYKSAIHQHKDGLRLLHGRMHTPSSRPSR